MPDREKQYNIDVLSALAKHTITKMWVVIILLILLLFGTNAAWIYYESQWEVVETTEVKQDVDTQNGAAYVAGVGDVYYGESKTNDSENQIP